MHDVCANSMTSAGATPPNKTQQQLLCESAECNRSRCLAVPGPYYATHSLIRTPLLRISVYQLNGTTVLHTANLRFGSQQLACLPSASLPADSKRSIDISAAAVHKHAHTQQRTSWHTAPSIVSPAILLAAVIHAATPSTPQGGCSLSCKAVMPPAAAPA